MRYIEWLTTPPDMRNPPTEEALAAELDVYPKTLYNWRHDREFKQVWNDEADQVLGGEEGQDKRQQVINKLHEVAMDDHHPRQIAAAKEFLAATRDLRPEMGDDDLTAERALSMLDDDELEALIAKGAAAAIEGNNGT